MRPQTRKDRVTPTTDTTTAWARESPNPRTHEPHEIPRTEIFAANHGMNRSEGFPCDRIRDDVQAGHFDGQSAR